MMIRFLRDWRGYTPGQEVDADYNLAEIYIQNGHAVAVGSGLRMPEEITTNPVPRKRGRPPLVRS